MSQAFPDHDVADSERQALALSTQGASLEESLGELISAVESSSPGRVLGSILLLDAQGKHLLHGAAPSLPAEYCHAIHGIAIGPTVGSCGAAAHGGHIIMVQDISTDPLWVDFRDLALSHGLRACWSAPIRSSRGAILGTFALYHRVPTVPTVRDRQLVARLSQTAAAIIESSRAEGPSRASPRHEHDVPPGARGKPS